MVIIWGDNPAVEANRSRWAQRYRSLSRAAHGTASEPSEWSAASTLSSAGRLPSTGR